MSLANTYNAKEMKSPASSKTAILLALLIVFFAPDVYAACIGTPRMRVIPVGWSLESAICGIAYVAQSNVAKGIASLAVIMLGISAMLGKVSWTTALLVAVGIAVVFNANNILCSIVGIIGSCRSHPLN